MSLTLDQKKVAQEGKERQGILTNDLVVARVNAADQSIMKSSFCPSQVELEKEWR